jgi:hypothetical protein
MLGLIERTRLRLHEATLRDAAAFGAASEANRDVLANAIGDAVDWLRNKLCGQIYPRDLRSVLSGPQPSAWRKTSGQLIRASVAALNSAGLPRYYAFAILAAIVESHSIEAHHPALARRALTLRASAVSFVEEMLKPRHGGDD